MAEMDISGAVSEMLTLARRDKSVTYVVEYTAPYAVHVHENLEVFHPNGQAKFLEEPARELAPDLGKEAAELMKGGMRLDAVSRMMALRVLAASQELVPVDTGFLKRSGRIRKETLDG